MANAALENTAHAGNKGNQSLEVLCKRTSRTFSFLCQFCWKLFIVDSEWVFVVPSWWILVCVQTYRQAQVQNQDWYVICHHRNRWFWSNFHVMRLTTKVKTCFSIAFQSLCALSKVALWKYLRVYLSGQCVRLSSASLVLVLVMVYCHLGILSPPFSAMLGTRSEFSAYLTQMAVSSMMIFCKISQGKKVSF